jgi:hypothetical protein
MNGVRDQLAWVTRPVFVKATEKQIVSSASEVDLLNGEGTIPANYIGANGALRVQLAGDYLNNTGNDRTLTLALKFGASTLWSDTSTNLPASGTRHDWSLECYIANRNATNSQFTSGVFLFSYHGAATTGIGDFSKLSLDGDGPFFTPFGSSGPSAIDTTASQLLQFTAQHSASASTLSIRLESATAELVGQAA